MIVALIIGPYGLMSMGLWDYCTFEYIGPEHHTSSINIALLLDNSRPGCMIITLEYKKTAFKNPWNHKGQRDPAKL